MILKQILPIALLSVMTHSILCAEDSVDAKKNNPDLHHKEEMPQKAMDLSQRIGEKIREIQTIRTSHETKKDLPSLDSKVYLVTSIALNLWSEALLAYQDECLHSPEKALQHKDDFKELYKKFPSAHSFFDLMDGENLQAYFGANHKGLPEELIFATLAAFGPLSTAFLKGSENFLKNMVEKYNFILVSGKEENLEQSLEAYKKEQRGNFHWLDFFESLEKKGRGIIQTKSISQNSPYAWKNFHLYFEDFKKNTRITKTNTEIENKKIKDFSQRVVDGFAYTNLHILVNPQDNFDSK